MPRAHDITGRRVFGAGDRPLGRVSAVLFHPSESRVVGIEVQPAALFYVFSRRPRFVRLEDVEIVGTDAVRLTISRLPSDVTGERALGYSWQDTVVWRGMPVRSSEGDAVGAVHDAVFASGDGSVTKLVISTGAMGDATLGRLEVSGDLVRGFDGEFVTVLPGYNEIRATGGAAKTAAAGAAMAKVQGERLASSALKAGATAAAAVGRSFRSGAGRKALDAMKSWMGEEDDTR